ncbi:hypothetical protein KKI93_23395, partial [Xenorhabdus bovienii]
VEIYLNQITQNGWAGVVYLFPEPQLRDRVKRIFYAVDAASIGGRLQPLSPEMTDRFFDFKTYEEFARE